MNKMATIETLNESIATIGDTINTTNEGLDVFYLLFAGALVFFMQAGFAMLCAGSIRAKNVKNIMCKNILDACGGAVGFWTIGYAFAYGGADSSKITFIGIVDFALEDIHDGASLIGWFLSLLEQSPRGANLKPIFATPVCLRALSTPLLCTPSGVHPVSSRPSPTMRISF